MRNSILLVFLAIFQSFSVQASSVLDKQISIDAKGENLKSILEQIEMLADVTFSYQSDVINQKQLLDVSFQSRSLDDILQEIFAGTNVQFNSIGSQIILHKSVQVQAPEPEAPPRKKPSKIVYDTLLVYDTVTIADTAFILNYDTVRVFDTNFVQQIVPQEPEDNANVFSAEILCGAYYGFGTNDEINEKLLKVTQGAMYQTNQMLLFGIGKHNWQLKTGVGFAGMWQSFDAELYKYTNEQHSRTEYYYEPSMDSVWIVMPGTDTVWMHQEDSVQRSVSYTDTVEKSDTAKYSPTNTVRYLSIPVFISYSLPLNEKWSIDIMGGIISNICIHNSGLRVAEQGHIEKTKAHNVYLTGHIGAQLSYSLSGGIVLGVQPTYRLDLTPRYENEPLNTQWAGIQFSVQKRF